MPCGGLRRGASGLLSACDGGGTVGVVPRCAGGDKGIYPSEAGVELLIRSGRAVYDGAPWITRDGDMAWIDVDELLRETGAWSGGERRLVRIAASLLGGPAG